MAPWNIPEKSQYVLIRISVIICCLVYAVFLCVFFLIGFLVNFDRLAKKNKMENKFDFFGFSSLFFFREELAKVLVDG
jgi:hypothetical protein